MFLIKFITIHKASAGSVTEQTIGYMPTEQLAIKYCKERTSKLKCNKNMVIFQ